MNTPLIVSVPDSLARTALGELPDTVEVVEWDMKGPAPVASIDIVIPPYLQSLEGMEGGCVQSLSLGYDGVADVLPKNMTFANAASVHETSTAEMALALILAS